MTGVSAKVEFCGEVYELRPEKVFTVGREGDLVIDSNPFLHRRFLEVCYAENLWWLCNVGSQLSVTLAEPNGRLNAWLAPAARIPLVFSRVSAWFTAGPTTYEILLSIPEPPYEESAERINSHTDGTTTLGPVNLTAEQMRVVLALSETTLRRAHNAASEIPSSAEAARRLQWTLTKFNRKLDAVCEKLDQMGVRGLRGSADQLASNRRARLVEYALSTQMVTKEDLELLDLEEASSS